MFLNYWLYLGVCCMSIGRNIKMLREQRNMTQLDLARIAVCSIQTVSAWETDKKVPRMGTIEVIAKHFGVTKGDIIDGDEATITRLCLTCEQHAMLELFRKVPPDRRSLVVGMVEAALKAQGDA